MRSLKHIEVSECVKRRHDIRIPKEVVLKVEEAVVGAGQVRIYSAFAPFKL